MWKTILKVVKSPDFRAIAVSCLTLAHKLWNERRYQDPPTLPPPEEPDHTPKWRGKYYIQD